MRELVQHTASVGVVALSLRQELDGQQRQEEVQHTPRREADESGCASAAVDVLGSIDVPE
jgi:hypothetical protein